MFYFAYDGSINGDWLSHYAVRLASRHPDGHLHLIHVRENPFTPDQINEKIGRIATLCERAGVTLLTLEHPLRKSVFDTLTDCIPPGSESYVLCGTRARERHRTYLRGTISERLLLCGKYHVMAIRVVQTGLLGRSSDLLIPVAGHPRGFRSGMPFLELLAPDLSLIHFLQVIRVRRWRLRHLSYEQIDGMRQTGREYLHRIEQETVRISALRETRRDGHIAVSDDIAREILLYARRIRSHLIYMGVSERPLPRRFLYGSPIERTLRDAPCDVAIYRGLS